MSVKQLHLVKFLLQAAEEHLSRDNPASSGLAVSVAQDAIEIFAWTIAKEYEVSVNDKEPFTCK